MNARPHEDPDCTCLACAEYAAEHPVTARSIYLQRCAANGVEPHPAALDLADAVDAEFRAQVVRVIDEIHPLAPASLPSDWLDALAERIREFRASDLLATRVVDVACDPTEKRITAVIAMTAPPLTVDEVK